MGKSLACSNEKIVSICQTLRYKDCHHAIICLPFRITKLCIFTFEVNYLK